MIVKLTHPFLWRCFDRKALLEDCSKLNTFLNRLEKQSQKAPEPDNYKGDGFELFVECLIKLSPIDMRIGIMDYRPIHADGELDTGVDGVGVGINGNPATVQVKLRTADWVLTANNDHLSNFTNASYMKYGVKTEDDKNMLIVTTADSLHHFTTSEMFLNKVRCLNREMLRRLVDDNSFFWRKFIELWQKAFDELKES